MFRMFQGLIKSSAPKPINEVAPPKANKGPETLRKQLSVPELRVMAKMSNEYVVFRTMDKNVAFNETLKFTGQTNKGAQEVLHCGPGLVGFNYGEWAVIFKKNEHGFYYDKVFWDWKCSFENLDQEKCEGVAHIDDILEAIKTKGHEGLD